VNRGYLEDYALPSPDSTLFSLSFCPTPCQGQLPELVARGEAGSDRNHITTIGENPQGLHGFHISVMYSGSTSRLRAGSLNPYSRIPNFLL